jgi:hypothetical protein
MGDQNIRKSKHIEFRIYVSSVFLQNNLNILASRISRSAVRWKSTDVSEKYIAYIFRAEVKAKKETTVKQVTRRYILEERILHNDRCEKLESCKIIKIYLQENVLQVQCFWAVMFLRQGNRDCSAGIAPRIRIR